VEVGRIRRIRRIRPAASPQLFLFLPGPVARPPNHSSLIGPSFLHTRFTPPPALRPKLSPSLCHYRERSRSQRQSRTMSALKSQAVPDDPVERTSSPYSDPRQLGPKSKILATRTSNFHSTSLRMVSATNPSVNRTCKLSSFPVPHWRSKFQSQSSSPLTIPRCRLHND
jgi:hypothetical protein